MNAAALSEVSNGAEWNPDPSFSVAEAILADPAFASVLRAVLSDGHVMVPPIKTEAQPIGRLPTAARGALMVHEMKRAAQLRPPYLNGPAKISFEGIVKSSRPSSSATMTALSKIFE